MDTTLAPQLNTSAINESISQATQGESMATKSIRIVGYSILFFFGAIGNAMVILAVRKPKMRSVTNILIANLGFADLLVVIFNIPSVVTYAHLWQWPFGEVLCKFLPFLQGVTLNASVGTLLAIAVDRYWHIVLFKRSKMTLCSAYKIVLLIWLSSAVIPFPLLLYCKIQVLTMRNVQYVLCEEVWPDMTSRQAYTMAIFIVLYLVPLLVVLCLYTVVARSLKHQPVVSSRQGSRKKVQRRVICMLVIVVILFAFGWLPYHVIFIYIDFFNPVRTQALVTSVLFSQWLVFASSTCNPVVYALLNSNFRKEFIDMLTACGKTTCSVRVRTDSNSNSGSCVFVTSV